MIIDLRTYTTKPGQLGAWLKLYEEQGWPLQQKYLKKCLGFYSVDIGVINRVVHVWEFPDAGERERMRGAMDQDPAWLAFRAQSPKYFITQENRLMKPVPFWPMKPAAEGPVGVVDKRTYYADPGKLGEFFKIYEAEGLALQVRHLGRCIGFYQSEIGPQHQIVHFWAYADIADRERRRAGMIADPAWQAYLAKSAPLFTHQEDEILKPVGFWKAT
ncbi:MAG TPA: NIPSNAP family protein [Alphaproteobacteria bacterium]